jgi:hypothetical protein
MIHKSSESNRVRLMGRLISTKVTRCKIQLLFGNSEKHSNICIDQPSVTHLRPSKQRALHPLLAKILYDVNNGGGPNSYSICKASIIQRKISDTLKKREQIRWGNNGHTISRTGCTTVLPIHGR